MNSVEAFIAHKASIDAMIERLQNLSADHFNVAPENVNWGHVGSLGHVKELLTQTCEFIGA